MSRTLRAMLKRGFAAAGIGITSHRNLENLTKTASMGGKDLQFLLKLPDKSLRPAMQVMPLSCSQLRQDIFVLSETDFKRGGYFVEFGATNGRTLSNTYLLESEFGWNGLLAEPAHCWRAELFANRTAIIETDCVWSVSNQILKFNEAEFGEVSTLSQFSTNPDVHQDARKKSKSYEVRTISLLDLLQKHGAPTTIDYLSVDTEGSEFEILNAFDFSKYRFRVITVEHNFGQTRASIKELLTRHGYRQKFSDISDFDDWYVGNNFS